MNHQSWPIQWSVESSNLPLIRRGHSLPQHPNTSDSLSTLSVWPRWGWTLQWEDSISDRIALMTLLMSPYHHTGGDHTGCDVTSHCPGGQEGDRSCWSSYWIPRPWNSRDRHQWLWRLELNIFISERGIQNWQNFSIYRQQKITGKLSLSFP